MTTKVYWWCVKVLQKRERRRWPRFRENGGKQRAREVVKTMGKHLIPAVLRYKTLNKEKEKREKERKSFNKVNIESRRRLENRFTTPPQKLLINGDVISILLLINITIIALSIVTEPTLGILSRRTLRCLAARRRWRVRRRRRRRRVFVRVDLEILRSR